MTDPRACGNRRVLLSDPIWDDAEDEMEFRLTYEGPLYADNGGYTTLPLPRAKHKHSIRKKFHQQLKAFWNHHPALREWQILKPFQLQGKTISEHLADEFRENGYKFLPLVTEKNKVLCKLDVLMLRPGEPGGLLGNRGDIDNRLKTLFDALRKPKGASELGGATPDPDEDPFYCLLEDDKFVTNVSVETDTMLEPVPSSGDLSDVRLIIKVTLRSYGGPAMSEIFDGG